MKLAANSFKRVMASPLVEGFNFQFPATMGRRWSRGAVGTGSAAEAEDFFHDPMPYVFGADGDNINSVVLRLDLEMAVCADEAVDVAVVRGDVCTIASPPF